MYKLPASESRATSPVTAVPLSNTRDPEYSPSRERSSSCSVGVKAKGGDEEEGEEEEEEESRGVRRQRPTGSWRHSWVKTPA